VTGRDKLGQVGPPNFRRRVAASRLAPLAAFPTRLGAVGRHNGRVLAVSARWLAQSREHTNYTYDLEPLNLEHLAWFVAAVAARPVAEARAAIGEITGDSQLGHVLSAAASSTSRKGLADRRARLGRRIGWYALVRLLRPQHIVETGTDKGLGSCVLAAAMLRNGVGRVTTIDINPAAGSLIAAPYARVIDCRVGDSLAILSTLSDVDFFLHDSDHSARHEASELVAVTPSLTRGALLLSDNAHVTNELAVWAELHDRQFAYFAERPKGHWYPGAGIGAAHAKPNG
jgi:hypothetical protein